MNCSYFTDFLNQWKTLPLENGLPNIQSLEKINFGALEKNIFVMKRFTEDYFPIKRTGVQLKRIYGLDMKGVDFLGLFTGTDSKMVERNLNNILSHRCGGLIWSLALRPGGENIVVRTYGLPFRDEKGRPNLIVGFTEVVDGHEHANLKSMGNISIWPVQRVDYFDLGHGMPV